MVEPTGRVAAANSPAKDSAPATSLAMSRGFHHQVGSPPAMPWGSYSQVVPRGRALALVMSTTSRLFDVTYTAPGAPRTWGITQVVVFRIRAPATTTATSSHVARTARRPTTSVPMTGRSAPSTTGPASGSV